MYIVYTEFNCEKIIVCVDMIKASNQQDRGVKFCVAIL